MVWGTITVLFGCVQITRWSWCALTQCLCAVCALLMPGEWAHKLIRWQNKRFPQNCSANRMPGWWFIATSIPNALRLFQRSSHFCEQSVTFCALCIVPQTDEFSPLLSCLALVLCENEAAQHFSPWANENKRHWIQISPHWKHLSTFAFCEHLWHRDLLLWHLKELLIKVAGVLCNFSQ